jgi:cytochrome c oxidase subunit 1
MGGFAAIYYWFPKMFGRQLSPLLGRIHFAGTLVFALLTFGGLLLAGYSGQGRRLFDPFQYDFLVHLKGINRHTTYAAFGLGTFQLVFAWNFVWSALKGQPASDNPWQATTLEWTTSSPPPTDNFADDPEVLCGPHELSHPESVAAYERDYVMQTEARARGGEP